MSKIIIKDFDTVIYPRHVFVAIGGTREDIADNFCDTDGDPYYINPDDVENSEAMTLGVNDKTNEQGGSLVWFHNPDNIKQKNITHESVHAANLIFKDCDIRIDCDNDEAQAYLAGFVGDCIYKTVVEHTEKTMKKK